MHPTFSPSFRLCACLALGLFCWSASANYTRADRIGFLVAEYPQNITHKDSFVITIDESDTNRLAQARKLVAWIESGAAPETSPDGRIIFTHIAAGADGINRNLLAPPAHHWSWHTVGEIEFADITAEIFDGWPTFVEEDVPGWISNTEGKIGFWSYTIVRELGLVPEPAAELMGISLLAFVVVVRRQAQLIVRRK